tara:strand:+ start:1727 stop:2527 length:801 start_codon:yes stop_codon:yes gene_type:complete
MPPSTSGLVSALTATGGILDDINTVITHGVTGDPNNPSSPAPTPSPSPSQLTWDEKSMDDMDRFQWYNPADWLPGTHEEKQYEWRARKLYEDRKTWHPHYPGDEYAPPGERNPTGIGRPPEPQAEPDPGQQSPTLKNIIMAGTGLPGLAYNELTKPKPEWEHQPAHDKAKAEYESRMSVPPEKRRTSSGTSYNFYDYPMLSSIGYRIAGDPGAHKGADRLVDWRIAEEKTPYGYTQFLPEGVPDARPEPPMNPGLQSGPLGMQFIQ